MDRETKKLELSELDDLELAGTIAALTAEQQRRAIDSNDTEALIEQGFEKGFDHQGRAVRPWLHNGLLICPGSVQETGATSHRCCLVVIEKDWVWQSEHLVDNEVRKTTNGKRVHQRSVSIIAGYQGMFLSIIKSKQSNNVHKRENVESFEINKDHLTLTQKIPSHNNNHSR